MSDSFDGSGLDAVPVRAAEAAEALERLKEPAEAAASAIETAFSEAGESLARSLARAAADGEITGLCLPAWAIWSANGGRRCSGPRARA